MGQKWVSIRLLMPWYHVSMSSAAMALTGELACTISVQEKIKEATNMYGSGHEGVTVLLPGFAISW